MGILLVMSRIGASSSASKGQKGSAKPKTKTNSDLTGGLGLPLSTLLLVILIVLLVSSVGFMRDGNAPRALTAILALVIGVGGIWALFYLLNEITQGFSERVGSKILPYMFITPALLFLGLYLFYPIVRTIIISFYDRTSENFVGFANYAFIFTDPSMLIVMRNTLLWLVIAPAFSVIFGLLVAVMTDHLQPFWEKFVKSLIFLPMAISFVGASVIWRFVFYFRPEGLAQIGILNAIVTWLGAAPKAWLTQLPWQGTAVPWVNNLFLIAIMVWLQTGFAMVILSSAVKGVPPQLLEAGRVDGAGEMRIFFRIIIPYISGTLLTVTTTILILVLKIFDVVFVMTSGQYDTNVVASRMYFEAFKFRNYGRGTALAVLLFIAVLPFIYRNIRHLRQSEKR